MPPQLSDSTRLPEEAVIWGPFPLRRARLAGGVAILPLAGLLFLIGLQHHILTCARSGPLSGQCEWQTGLRESSVRRFPLAALRSVRVAYSQTQNKNHVTHWGQLALNIDGRERMLLRQPAAEADQAAASLQAFLRDPAQPTLRLETARSLPMLGLGAAFALVGGGLLYSVWYGRRRFRFTWEVTTQQLTMQLQWPPGIDVGPAVTWSLPSPVDVEISWGEVKDAFSSSRSPGPRGGRLQVRLAGGELTSLLAAPMAGYGVHLRAAEQLRRLIRCPERSAAAAARTEAAYAAERPQLGPGWTGSGGRVAATWLGACCGALLGIAVSGTLGLVLGVLKTSDSADGPWFFGGMLGGIAAGVALAWRLLLRPDER